MNKTFIIWLKLISVVGAAIGTTIVSGIDPFTLPAAVMPTKIQLIAILVGAFVNGCIALGAFCSRSYADHQDEVDNKIAQNPQEK